MKLSGIRVLKIECIPLDLHTAKSRITERFAIAFHEIPLFLSLCTSHVVHTSSRWCCQMSPGPLRQSCILGCQVCPKLTHNQQSYLSSLPCSLTVITLVPSQEHTLLGISGTHFPKCENKQDENESKGLERGSWNLFRCNNWRPNGRHPITYSETTAKISKGNGGRKQMWSAFPKITQTASWELI